MLFCFKVAVECHVQWVSDRDIARQFKDEEAIDSASEHEEYHEVIVTDHNSTSEQRENEAFWSICTLPWLLQKLHKRLERENPKSATEAVFKPSYK